MSGGLMNLKGTLTGRPGVKVSYFSLYPEQRFWEPWARIFANSLCRVLGLVECTVLMVVERQGDIRLLPDNEKHLP